MDFFKTYPYLIANVPLAFFTLITAKAVRPRTFGRLSVLSGLVCIPCSILALLHNESYWKPIRLGGGPIGIEDLVCTFVSGSLVWLLAAWPFRRNLTINNRFFPWIKRFCLIGVLFLGSCYILWMAGVGSLANTLVAGSLVLLVLLFLRNSLWPLSVTGFILFVPIYVLIVKVQFLIWPDYLLQWNLRGPLGSIILGLPVGEMAYAGVLGAVWPVYIAYVFNIDLGISRTASPDPAG